jgi:tRNA (guanine10-N2)-dimethyltransferase
MVLIVELSGEQPTLARQEAIEAAGVLTDGSVEVVGEDGPFLLLKAPGVDPSKMAGRMALAHRVSTHHASGPLPSMMDLASDIDLDGARTFRVRTNRRDLPDLDVVRTKAIEGEVGDLLRARSGTEVDLDAPEAEVRVLLGREVHVGVLGDEVDRKALERRAVRYRPYSKPISIHPKYARAMVNLAGVPRGGRVLDPMCGTGGILIEAALMGYQTLGSDIDPRMVSGSAENLSSLRLEADLSTTDVDDLPKVLGSPVDAIVTDPPYGRSTSTFGDDPQAVVGKLFRVANDILGPQGRLVVCLASDVPPLVEGGPLRLASSYPIRVHRSLTRYIHVISR